ncbi:Panacea domain-containing protein [Limosilactobacillus mucosae]|uniref:Panacea domain-containing protein n=1 Tax=Limosilactobacillus mucosae TaxID=97478 RepID=UPI000883CDE1|nr:type II toxin-antitoxin system antitoxin SocA domain-containing protein [Limosilactobacillus mucosae]SDN55105.1 Uncharacterized phage-associated protein [Limosilactobacillus mucosae]SEL10110.1 Uncharacterized phage-associated protein [Limosilactobacillus mucosae]SFK23409.1 Uncharacterized phage-associated protein [Limosilactobacillus mucosae]
MSNIYEDFFQKVGKNKSETVKILTKPYNAMDVANFLVDFFNRKKTPITNIMLLKILYYLQAFYLTHNDKLFVENIEKWGYGPVVPVVYSYFKDNGAAPITKTVSYVVENNNILTLLDPSRRIIQENDKKEIGEIATKLFNLYNNNPFDLVKITHKEPMWKESKDNILNGEHHIKYSEDEIISYFNEGTNWPW